MWLVQILYAFFVSVSQDLPQPKTFSYIFYPCNYIGAAPFYDPLVCGDPRIYCHILDIHLHLHHYYFHGFLEHVSPISFANRSEVTTPTRKLVGLRTVVLFNTSTHNLFVKSRLSLKCVISLLIITCIYLCNYFIPCYIHSNILLHFSFILIKTDWFLLIVIISFASFQFEPGLWRSCLHYFTPELRCSPFFHNLFPWDTFPEYCHNKRKVKISISL